MDTADIIASYDNSAEEYAQNREGKEPKRELAAFFKELQPGAKVLDVGCAAGRDTRVIKDAGFEPTGIDLSEKLLEIAKKRHPDITFVNANMTSLPFDDASFEAVWANAVLHHLEKTDMPKAINEFKRVLKPGGLLCVRTKMGEGVLKTNEAMVQHEAREFTLLTPEELDAMLQDAGLTKLSTETVESKSRQLFWINAFYRR